nr:hypothetical protein Aca09nite_67140 [Actinoplanes campanulatus]
MPTSTVHPASNSVKQLKQYLLASVMPGWNPSTNNPGLSVKRAGVVVFRPNLMRPSSKVAQAVSNPAEGETMQLTHLFTWKNSGGGNCPAVYATDRDSLVVQGYTLGTDAAAQMVNVAANESGIEIPYTLAEQIADMVNARRGQ